MSKVTLGSRVRELRKAAGLNQRELADRVGIDFTYLSKIENDRTEAPSEAVLTRIAAETDGKVDELLSLAGKIPSDLAEAIAKHPHQFAFLRQFLRDEEGKKKSK